jgi:hypothetical protein
MTYIYRMNILNKKNSNPLDAVAELTGDTQYDYVENKTYICNNSEKVIWNTLFIPSKSEYPDLYYNLPEFLKFRNPKPELLSNARNTLWANINRREIRPDSQFARVFELTIPNFLTLDESINLIKEFSTILLKEGMICDISLHDHNKKKNTLTLIEKIKGIKPIEDDNSQTHQDYTVNIMTTLRSYKDGQFGNKNRDWNSKIKLKEWRTQWTTILEKAILNSQAENTEKNSWLKNLKVYPEYNEMKQEIDILSIHHESETINLSQQLRKNKF